VAAVTELCASAKLPAHNIASAAPTITPTKRPSHPHLFKLPIKLPRPLLLCRGEIFRPCRPPPSRYADVLPAAHAADGHPGQRLPLGREKSSPKLLLPTPKPVSQLLGFARAVPPALLVSRRQVRHLPPLRRLLRSGIRKRVVLPQHVRSRQPPPTSTTRIAPRNPLAAPATLPADIPTSSAAPHIAPAKRILDQSRDLGRKIVPFSGIFNPEILRLP
jgi:hypothetical protein